MTASYSVVITKSAQREIRKLTNITLQRVIIRIIGKLAANPLPPGAVKIKGYKYLYRIRQGDYRIVYKVEHVVTLVSVVRVAHRRDVYRKL